MDASVEQERGEEGNIGVGNSEWENNGDGLEPEALCVWLAK